METQNEVKPDNKVFRDLIPVYEQVVPILDGIDSTNDSSHGLFVSAEFQSV